MALKSGNIKVTQNVGAGKGTGWYKDDGTAVIDELGQVVGVVIPGDIALPNTQILVGNASNVAAPVAMSGAITISNTGVTTIGANQVGTPQIAGLAVDTPEINLGAVLNAQVGAAAAIAYSKLAALPSGDILVGSAGNVPTAVAMSGDVLISNTGVTTLQSQKVFTAQVTLTNAQVLALNGTPIQIVASPGSANVVVLPISATMAYTFAVAAYATNTELDLIHAGSSVAMMKTSINQASSTFAQFASNATATPSAGNNFIANAALNLFVPAGNPTGGNVGASIKITVLYTLMSVL